MREYVLLLPIKDMVTEDSLIIHSLNVCYDMGAMAEHFGADKEHWMAVGYLHDMITRSIRMNIYNIPRRNFLQRVCLRRM